MDYIMSFQKEGGVNGADLLLFGGYLNLQNSQKIKKNLMKQLAGSAALHIKVEKAEQLDLSFLQLLLGLKIYFKEVRQPVYFDFELNKELESILTTSGFDELLLAKY